MKRYFVHYGISVFGALVMLIFLVAHQAVNAQSVAITGGTPPVTVAFTSNTGAANEAQANVNLILQLSAPLTETVTIVYTATAGTAAIGADFSLLTNTTTISAGSISHTLALSITNDSLYEATETFTISLLSATSASIVAPSVATIMITDDDMPPVLMWSNANYNISEPVGSATFTIMLDTTAAVSFTAYFTATNAISDTATPNVDFTAVLNQAIEIPPATTLLTVTVPISDDTSLENTETFTLSIYEPIRNSTNITQVAISDNETSPPTIKRVFLPLIIKPQPVCIAANNATRAGASQLLLDGRPCLGSFAGVENQVKPSEYYTFTRPINAKITLDLINTTPGGSNDYDLFVYEGTTIKYSSNISGTGNEQIVIPANALTAGQVYFIRVYWYGQTLNSTPTYTLIGRTD